MALRMMLIDTHSHIYLSEFEEDRVPMLERAAKEGVVKILMPAIDSDTHRALFELEQTHPDSCLAMMGLHPCSVKENYKDELKIAREWLEKRSFKGVGEIGLDFYYNHSAPDVQRSVFRRQLEIAGELNLPVVIHSREANRETIDILRENRHSAEKAGIFHCFSGDMEMALAAIDLGFMISFAGSLTFKKAAELRAVAKELPLDRLLIETDCPFLTPEPHRGKRNEPAYVTQVARQLGELKGISAEEIGRLTTENFYRFYGLK